MERVRRCLTRKGIMLMLPLLLEKNVMLIGSPIQHALSSVVAYDGCSCYRGDSKRQMRAAQSKRSKQQYSVHGSLVRKL